MLSTFGKGKSVETQGFQGKKRKFFKEKGAQKGGAVKKEKDDVVYFKCNNKEHYAHECRTGKGKKVQKRKV